MLEAESPWASQAAAETALEAVNGYCYQAFRAKQAIIKPHMQLGDYITAGAATGLMLSWDFDMDTYVGDVGAPEEYETNRKYPYRTAASRAGGVARAAKRLAKQAVGGIIENYNQLIAALNQKDGVPDALAAGLRNYVRYDLKNDESYAQSTLFAKVGEKAKAEISVYTVIGSDGKAHSLADIVADQITLESGLEDAKTSLELKADKEAVDGALTAIAALNTRVGDAESSLEQKVSHTEFRDAIDNQDEAIATLEEAQTTLSSRVGNAEASLKLKASQEEVQTVDGKVTTVSKSVAELEADVISLKGRIDLSGQVSVSNGQLTVLGNLVARDSLQVGKDSFFIAGQKYTGKPITSTDNTEYNVLGA